MYVVIVSAVLAGFQRAGLFALDLRSLRVLWPSGGAGAGRLGYGVSTGPGGPSGRTSGGRIGSKRLTISLGSCRRPISRFISPPRPATWSVETRLLERISTPSS